MNDIFNFFSPLSFVKSGTVAYNPLINYDWSTTTTSGLRYLKDVGSTPTYNASMYFGRGAYLNGVDQTITVPINKTIQTALKRVNGVVTINETSQTLTNYVISGLGVHKDYYLFTRLLTTAEKDSYTNTPELFYAMAQTDNTCVLNMPMCETDGYVRDMKNYSETSVVNEEMDNFSNFTNFLSQSTLSSSGGILTHISLAAYAKIYIRQNLVANTTYKIEVDLIEASSLFELKCSYIVADNSELGRVDSSTPTKLVLFVKPTTSGSAFVTLQNSVSGKTLKYNYLRVTAVTDTYPITNYTSSVRGNAKNLQYGLQTCKFVRDSLGVIQSASNYLECNGTGYATIPSHTDTVNIKMTVNPTSLSGNLLSGGVTKTLTGLTLNVDNDVVISNVTPIGAITLASGFSGTIKTYTEELS